MSYVPLWGYITPVVLTPPVTTTIIDKITIFCDDVNKTSSYVKLLAINIPHYMSQRSNVGLAVKSMAGVKTFMEVWNGHNNFAYPLEFDELLQQIFFLGKCSG